MNKELKKLDKEEVYSLLVELAGLTKENTVYNSSREKYENFIP